MIGSLRGVSVWAYGEPCDLRKSFNTLQALVEREMKRDLSSGDLFVFVAKNRKRAKVLYFDSKAVLVEKHERKACVRGRYLSGLREGRWTSRKRNPHTRDFGRLGAQRPWITRRM